MPYVNLKNLFKLEFVHNIVYLFILKHAGKKENDVYEYLLKSGCTLGHLKDLEKQGYVKFIKGKKNETEFLKARLDKKGVEFLNSLDEPSVEEEDITIFNWLSGVYKERQKQIGNIKKTKYLIASFREKSGIDKNKLAFLCKSFINDDDEQEYSFKLEYVFWKPQNLFQVRFNLDDSRLWQYYNKNKKYFDNKFKTMK